MRRGFTLIELLVGGAIGLVVVLAAAVFVLQLSGEASRRRRALERLARRDRIAQSLAEDIDASGRHLAFSPFPQPRVVAATAKRVGFVGDLPRPGFRFTGPIEVVAGPPSLPATLLPVRGLASGGVVPPADGHGTELGFPRSTARCSETLPEHCPWSAGVVPGSFWQLVGPSGLVGEVRIGNPGVAQRGSQLLLEVSGLPFATWADAAGLGAPLLLVQRDLVTWSFDDEHLALGRLQCWGPSSGDPCGGFKAYDLMLSELDHIGFRYFDRAGVRLGDDHGDVPAAELARIGHIELSWSTRRDPQLIERLRWELPLGVER